MKSNLAKVFCIVQRKKNNREECIIPGGKREGNETDFETLKRELDELRCIYTFDVVDMNLIGEKLKENIEKSD